MAGPKPCLHVTDGDASIKRGQCAAEGRVRVSLDEGEIGLLPRQETVDRLDTARGQACEALVGPHQVKVRVGHEPEGFKRLIEQLAVLPGYAEPAVEGRMGLEREDDRSHLDRPGPGAEDDRDLVQGPGLRRDRCENGALPIRRTTADRGTCRQLLVII